jgi:chromate transporter
VTDVSLPRFVAYFLRLGTTGFGGPIALAGAMQRDLVEDRRWIRNSDYRDGLALAQLAPGPLAAQLAMYLGYVRAGITGATLVALAFIAPSFLIVWLLSIAYMRFGGLAWMQAVFYGVGACVIGIIVRSAIRLTSTLARRADLWIIFVVVAAVTAILERELLMLVIASGLVTMLAARWRAIPNLAVASPLLLSQIFWFFAKAGAVVFGSGLAIVPFLYGGVVEEYHWLTDRQFLDAVAVAMITPGPVVITVAFIGYVKAREAGMFAAASGVFLPVYLFVILPAPYFRRYRDNEWVQSFVLGVTAAATGAIAGAAIVLARRALVDVWTLLIGLVAFLVLMRWRISELWLIGAAAVLGLALRGMS